MATEHRPRFQYESSGRESAPLAERCTHATTVAIRDFPFTSLMVAFGFGLGVGAAIGVMLADTMEPAAPRSQWEQIGRRVIDSLADVMPEGVGHRLHS